MADPGGLELRALRNSARGFGYASETPPADPFQLRLVVEEVGSAIDALPSMQRAVMTLRDVAGVGAGTACALLGIQDTEQRVHLHRACTAVRAAVEELLRLAA